MKLKTLEIKGFKSFADRTQIHFTEDVIGIVGPNGCGKSNIVDAIRWVLGEQRSKELRSDKMENVIFNGTKERKPAGVAEVSLTFENTKNILPTEYNMVTIKRILYSTGESEYRLNDVKCRLKDVQNLLMDTGMSSDSYSIIALGMVDDLLNDRENARRKLFEQAAGISKYKIRKHETLQKLKSTDEDLMRVQDLLAEIEKNRKGLEKQAKRTQKYYEIKAEYKEISVQVALFKIQKQREVFHHLEVQEEKEKNTQLVLEAKINQLEASVEKQKLENLDKEKNLSERQRNLNQHVGRIKTFENDKKMASQKALFVQENEKKWSTQIEQSERKLQTIAHELERFKQEHVAEESVTSILQQELKEAKNNLQTVQGESQTIKGELDIFLKEQQNIERQTVDLEKKIAVTESQMRNAEMEIDRLRHDIAKRQGENDQVATQVQGLQTSIHEKEQTVKGWEENEQQRNQTIESTEQRITELNKRLAEESRKLDAKRNEYKLLKSMVDSLEGFPESVKYLSKNMSWKYEAPLLSDIIYCQEAYRTAIENYLEPYLNYYIVQNEQEAIAAIRLLDKAQKGKANFFLLENIPHTDKTPTLEDNAPMPAVAVVTTDKKYEGLIRFLLSNVFIVENSVLETLPTDTIRIFLAHTGHWVKRPFAANGGSVGIFEGKKIGRRKNLELLQEEIKQTETLTKEVQIDLENARKQVLTLKNSSQKQAIQQEKEVLNKLFRELTGLQLRLDSFANYQKENTDRQTKTKESIEAWKKEHEEVQAKLSSFRADLAGIKQKIGQTDTAYKKIAEATSQASSLYNQKNIDFIRQQNKLQSIVKEWQFREKQSKELNMELELSLKNKKQTTEELATVQYSLESLEAQLAAAYAERKEKEKELTAAEQSYFQARGEVNTIENELRQEQRKKQENLVLLNSLQTKINEVKFALHSLGESLRIEFNLVLQELLDQSPNPKLTEPQAQQEMEKLRQRLTTYGEINPMAIEAYQEIKERYDFIMLQYDDLVKAKTSLLDTITEIEQTATQRFLEAFGQVRTHFIHVFRSLFSEEDDCDLVLTDMNNPLEAHVNIIAKPKGKRPLTINQLSGGEKTLTATALLFSLYLLKPAPFCIFDEVDAPLDDANIAKFSNIIKKFSKDSQFIIVTHNKQTMSAVDTMYGVMMSPPGVSQLVPVDFRQLSK